VRQVVTEKDLDDKSRRPFDGPFCYDATAIVANEKKIGLDHGCESKNQISRRCIDVAELIGKNVLGKHKVKATRDFLMFCAGRRRDGQLSIKDLITISVVG
jgi:hypothetical protein